MRRPTARGAWTDKLAQELAEADAFILLIGPNGVGQWQVPEYDEALDRWVKSGRTFPLVVVLLEGQITPGLPFLRQLHWIVTPDPASEKDVARIFHAAFGQGGRPSELWRHASPYRGLEAMEEKDSDYFFGRTRETVEALNALAALGRLPLLIGNSGVGKSLIAQAGVLAALKRQAWPGEARAGDAWPAVFKNSRRWCFMTLRPGAEPIKARPSAAAQRLGDPPPDAARGMDRSLRTSTVKRRVHSLFRQGCLLYDLVPNMPEDRLRPLLVKYEEFLNENRVFTETFGFA